MKTILSILLISISAMAYSQDSTALRLGGDHVWTYYRTAPDTIPVVMLVCDTSVKKGMGYFYIFHNFTDTSESVGYSKSRVPHVFWRFGYSASNGPLECKYLDDKKQPLPERFVVWMAVRRKPDSIHN